MPLRPWAEPFVVSKTIRANRFVESPFAHPVVMFCKNPMDVEDGPYRSGDFPEDSELWLRWMVNGVNMTKIENPGATVEKRILRQAPHRDLGSGPDSPEASHAVKQIGHRYRHPLRASKNRSQGRT
jgi:hypothetical protein